MQHAISPARYGSQVLAAYPGRELIAYAGHHSVVLASARTGAVLRTLGIGFSK